MKNSCYGRKLLYLLLALLLLMSLAAVGCGDPDPREDEEDQQEDVAGPVELTDMLGRKVTVPENVERIAALRHLGTMVFALGEQDKLVHQGLFDAAGHAMAELDPEFAALPGFKNASVEELMKLKVELFFNYYDTDPREIEQLAAVGIPFIALKSETLEESYEAVRIMGKALRAEDKAEEYIAACQKIVNLVETRTERIPRGERPRVFFAGAKSIYTAATGEMLQDVMIKMAGGINVAEGIVGRWAQISPEQLVRWNPDIIFLGSSLDQYAAEDVFGNTAIQSVNAIKNNRVYPFPSNIGWWDFPAPHCVLGIEWMATKLHPELYRDIDMTEVADEFYCNFMGRTFTELGGKL